MSAPVSGLAPSPSPTRASVDAPVSGLVPSSSPARASVQMPVHVHVPVPVPDSSAPVSGLAPSPSPARVSVPVASVAITGAAGYVGSRVLAALAADRRSLRTVLALDVRDVPSERRLAGVAYELADIRSPAPTLAASFRRHAVESVVHLASVVAPGSVPSREAAYAIDVAGTRNVLEACLEAGVRHIVVLSSGAAYGFHADNPLWLRETDRLRGNEELAYACHKRLVEEMLADHRQARPELRQLVFRPGAIVGRGVSTPVTALFEGAVVLGVRGAASPFTFIWDEDVARCIATGVHERREGVYNLAADGALTLREIARHTGKPFVPLPAALLRGALRALRAAGLAPYGPEHVDFIRYRSVLVNDALKGGFGYAPRLTSREAFDLYRESTVDSRESRVDSGRSTVDRSKPRPDA